MKSRNRETILVIKFVVSGLVSTSLAYIAYLCFFFKTSNEIVSLIFSYLIAIPISYHLNCTFVFREKYSTRSYLSFVIIQMSAMLINYIIINKLNNYMENHVSAVISFGCVPLIVYLANKIIVFKK